MRGCVSAASVCGSDNQIKTDIAIDKVAVAVGKARSEQNQNVGIGIGISYGMP